ncbi:OLC1v1018525C1 [Oldenlandia corymbosa var. corymbosa]|uniref:OLC1v1018525C1 n=1 Tax=Oldenlandia corymbosa var. corymbosa TaxID=529605 RepID=A0AAV1EBT3_OLDCO|nr:OLC1v1018525C1 [Oldenlandia corymbosa var. corymbosa]
MGSVYYCCIWKKGGGVVYAYNGGDPEIENLAALCLEKTPPYHRWYLQTMGRKTFGFLMDAEEDGYVYFVIADEVIGNKGVLRFLEHLGKEFRKVTKKGSSKSHNGEANVNSSFSIQDQLVPVIHCLISSFESMSRIGGGDGGSERPEQVPAPYSSVELSPSPNDIVGNGQVDGVPLSKAPLLGKPSKQEKKKMKEHIIGIRDIELEENHRKSADRGGGARGVSHLGAFDSNSQSSSSVSPLQKDFGSARFRSSSSQLIQKRWCRQAYVGALSALVDQFCVISIRGLLLLFITCRLLEQIKEARV